MEIKGKTIIVTGAASGIGRGLCQRFAKEGAKAIVAADINEAGAKAVAAEVGGEAFVCDVRKEADVAGLVKFTEDKFGGVDLFCSNAGIIAIGFVVSFAVALAVVHWLLRWIGGHDFRAFGWYRIALGIVVLGVWALQTFVLA